MITDFGKFMDPIADKLTQAVVAFCLCLDYPIMKLLLGVRLGPFADAVCTAAARAVSHAGPSA